MRRGPLFLSLTVFVIAVQSVCLAFGGPAPEIEGVTPEVEVAPAAVKVNPPQVAPSSPAVTPTPETKVEPATPPAKSPAVKAGAGLYRVRIGLFSRKEPAAALMNKLKSEGHPAFLVSQAGLWRVQVGAYRDSGKAEEVAADLKAKGYQVDVMASD